LYLLIRPYFIRIFLQNIYTPIVYDNLEQNYSTSIISLENSGSSLPASKSQSNSESDSPSEMIKGRTFSNERFHINFAQSSEITSSQYLQKCWQISGVHFKIDSSHKFTTLSRIGLTKPLCHFNWVVVSSFTIRPTFILYSPTIQFIHKKKQTPSIRFKLA
jgi:hypothetical protein